MTNDQTAIELIRSLKKESDYTVDIMNLLIKLFDGKKTSVNAVLGLLHPEFESKKLFREDNWGNDNDSEFCATRRVAHLFEVK